MVDASVGEADQVLAFGFGSDALRTRGVPIGALDPLFRIDVGKMLDVDWRCRRDLVDMVRAKVDTAVHDGRERDGAFAKEPDLMLRPVVGTGVERAEDPMAAR